MPATKAAADPLPDHWYLFFGILEPISVLAGTIYAIYLPERYNHELIPPAFVSSSKIQSSLQTIGVLPAATRMALGQLGSCYFLIMLNSALMFFALRKFLRGKDNVALEKITRYLIFVLGAADWTHIGLTLALLPNGPPRTKGVLGIRQPTIVDKFTLLSKPGSWNSLLFGNIIITLILFCFRAMWWIGLARGSPIAELKKQSSSSSAGSKKRS